MNETQIEAIANADAYTSNAGLPSYKQLLTTLNKWEKPSGIFLRRNDMNETQIEAIANADAHTSNAGLPSYSQLLQALESAIDATRFDAGWKGWNAAKEKAWASLKIGQAVTGA